MSEPASLTDVKPVSGSKNRKRVIEYLIILVVIGVVVIAAFFQEQISSYLSLKMWDKGAPGRVVTDFLAAGKKGDQTLATSYLGASEFKPMMKDGKWKGYFIVSQAGTLEFDMQQLAPAGDSATPSTEFFTIGRGYAEVSVPDSSGKPTKYRLEMKDGWKITEILGGRPAEPEAPKQQAPAKAPTAPKGG